MTDNVAKLKHYAVVKEEDMPRLHIIIGDSNTRKSSTLRCLTGVGGGNAKKTLQVALANGAVIDVYCVLSALQENYKPLTPQDFIKHINAMRPIPTDIALTLRVNAQGKFPNAAAYFQAFASVNWPIENLALLGPSACALTQLPVCSNIARAPHSSTTPTNATARDVRAIWGWA